MGRFKFPASFALISLLVVSGAFFIALPGMSAAVPANVGSLQPAFSSFDPLQGGTASCNVPVNITDVQIGSLSADLSRPVRVSLSVTGESLPACVTVSAFRIQVFLNFPDSTIKRGEALTSNIVRSATSQLSATAIVSVAHLPKEKPTGYRIAVIGTPDLSHFGRPATASGTISLSNGTLSFGFGPTGTCPNASDPAQAYSCAVPVVCSITGVPGTTAASSSTISAQWSIQALPNCVRITQFRVRAQLTFPDQTSRTLESVVSGASREASFSITNAPANSVSVTFTIKPEPASDIVVTGAKSATL